MNRELAEQAMRQVNGWDVNIRGVHVATVGLNHHQVVRCRTMIAELEGDDQSVDLALASWMSGGRRN